MNNERFQALAAAYGATVSRWPIAERGAARWFAFRHRRSSEDILLEARRLDRILQRSTSPQLGVELRGALIEGARCLRETTEERRSWFGTFLGMGLAAACAAGIGAGFVIAPLTANDALTSPADPVEVAASALGNPTDLGDG
jgi:hypothetical protein